MHHIKLFEDFDQNYQNWNSGQSYNQGHNRGQSYVRKYDVGTDTKFDEDPDENEMNDPNNIPDTYVLFIRSKEGDDLAGEVRNEDGKIICNVDQGFIDDGVMQHPKDLSGLREYLTDKKKMKEQDILNINGEADSQEVQINNRYNPNTLPIRTI